MDLLQFAPALIGGILIGLSAACLMYFVGHIAGISGITFSAVIAPKANFWSIVFILGVIMGAALLHRVLNIPLPSDQGSLTSLSLGAFLVGMGTRLGSGCTSGHGICGLARLSPRSLVATLTFMGCAIITVFIRLHILA